MTSLVAWVAGHTKGQASLNIATDNRISWSTTHNGKVSVLDTWDQGRKVFASKRYPIIIGYCGDVLFPVIAIPALLDRVDVGGTPENYVRSEEISRVVNALIGRLKSGWKAYPRKALLTVYIGYREDRSIPAPGKKEDPAFHLLRLSTSESRSWTWNIKQIQLPNNSHLLASDGSGGNAVKAHIEAWNATTSGHTSRAIYSGFVDAILSGIDPLSGGAPQLASLYRKGSGRLLGIIHKNTAYYAGLPVDGRDDLSSVEFRNATFERVDSSGRLLKGAQKQERPDHVPPALTISS
ncbi:hypothetical protein ACSBOX_06125 [Arthrobacter sp. KN11-1C]|uniref:hypothetical protein n=1 Tax=Arthrobacter sp. KN11-1C TaxID=3445774 RepID=UPI003FA05270